MIKSERATGSGFKKALSFSLALIMLMSCFSIFSFSASSNEYLTNNHFKRITYTAATQMYKNSEKFILMVYSEESLNSQYIGTNAVMRWMNTYNTDIYGIDNEVYGIPTWVYTSGATITDLPIVLFVDKAAVVNSVSGASEAKLKELNEYFFDFIDVVQDSFIITYDAGEGINAPDAQYGNGIVNISEIIPTREGYSFLGWNYNDGEKDRTLQPGASFNLKSDISLTAIWAKDGYQLTFDLGNDNAIGAPSSLSGYELTIPETIPTLEYHVFSCWKDNESGKTYLPGAGITLTKDVTLTAQWEELKFNLTYNENGGVWDINTKPAIGEANQANGYKLVITDAEPTKAGNAFMGWSRSPYASSADYTKGENIKIASDTTLYAVWKKLYTVRFHANGGAFSDESTVIERFSTTDFTIDLDSVDRPSKNKYDFLGWSEDAFADTATYKVNNLKEIELKHSETDLYAIWGKLYTLTFNANGGYGAPSPVVSNGLTAIPSTTPIRTGFTFLGWSTSANATTASYAPGSSFNLATNTTLYAVWRYNTTISIRNYKTDLTVAYKTTITFHAYLNNSDMALPSATSIHWYINGKDSGAAGRDYTVVQAKSSFTIQAKLVSNTGEILSESRIENVKVSSGIFARIIAFFRNLFGTLPIISQ